MTDTMSRRRFGALAAATTLAGCAVRDPAGEPLRPMGTFQLASAIVVARGAQRIPPSRDASEADLKRVMQSELERRFGRYEGGTLFYVAVNVDGYSLARPGIPIVLAPKSVLIISANVWTAVPQAKIGGPEQITTFEGADTAIVGSGLIRDADEQLATLARNAAKKVQDWMLTNPEWFGLEA